jgi:uncharacterized protein YjiS (DUF1127 family)
MQYQNHGPRAAWNAHPQSREGGVFEIAGIGVRPGDPDAPRARSDPGRWQRSIERAIAVALEQAAESLALYAAGMEPQLFLLLSEPGARVGAADLTPGPTLPASRPSLALGFREAPPASPVTPYEGAAGRFLPPSQPIEPERPGWTAWILSIPGKLWSTLLLERDVRRSRDALLALDDRTLKDIGLSRSEIDRAARYGRSRE